MSRHEGACKAQRMQSPASVAGKAAREVRDLDARAFCLLDMRDGEPYESCAHFT